MGHGVFRVRHPVWVISCLLYIQFGLHHIYCNALVGARAQILVDKMVGEQKGDGRSSGRWSPVRKWEKCRLRIIGGQGVGTLGTGTEVGFYSWNDFKKGRTDRDNPRGDTGEERARLLGKGGWARLPTLRRYDRRGTPVHRLLPADSSSFL